MRNVVIWGWHTPSAIAAIRAMESQKLIDIKHWVGEAPDCDLDLDHLVHQFNIGSPSYQGAASGVYNELYQALPQFLELYSRVSFSLGKTYQQQLHIFNVYLDYFAQMLTANRVDLVLFSNLPHFGVDYLLYLVAKKLGIQVVMTTQSLVENRFFYLEEIEDFGFFQFAESDPYVKWLGVENKFSKDLFYMKPRQLKKAQCKKNCYASLLNDLLHLMVLKKSKPMTLSGVVCKFQQARTYKKFGPSMLVHQADFNRKYVYFPLQLQPELTTSTLGGVYVDQLLALERLSDMLPEDWRIYVKENPKQNRRQRDEFFFARLKRITKAVYLSHHIDTYELIRGCQFVAVVTGTAGWEAISGGKNALIFGKAWYRSLPGVFEYRPGLTVEHITSFQVDHQDLERRYNEMMQRTAKGSIDPSYNVMVKDYSDERNAAYLSEFVQKILTRTFTSPWN